MQVAFDINTVAVFPLLFLEFKILASYLFFSIFTVPLHLIIDSRQIIICKLFCSITTTCGFIIAICLCCCLGPFASYSTAHATSVRATKFLCKNKLYLFREIAKIAAECIFAWVSNKRIIYFLCRISHGSKW